MKNILNMLARNWRTSLAALLIVAGNVWQCVNNGTALESCMAANWDTLLVAIGLLFAKDFNVTGTIQKNDD